MEKTIDPQGPLTGLNPLCDPVGYGDTERCVEIPWALSKYSDETTVLDVGYANAEERYIKSLLSLKIPNLHGLDISDRKIEGLISHVGDIRKTNFENNYFDFVFCISTIEHIGRDNSVYKTNFTEVLDKGDLDALKEIYRITKIHGKILITVPYGKFFNYGWFIQYDENRLNILLNCCPFEILAKEFFIYENGWHKCDKNDLKNILYHDNNAPAAAGLVCLLLKKMSNNQLSIQNVKNNNSNYKNMNDNTIGIRDDEINVEEIMEKIRENIRRRQAAGEVSSDSDSVIASTSKNCHPDPDDAIQRDISDINANGDIHNNSYVISSHNPYIGKLLVKGRTLVHGEVRRYVDPIIYRQNGFNASTVRILNHTSQKIEELNQNYRELETSFSRRQSEQDQKLRDLETSFSRRQSEQDQKISQVIAMVENEIDGRIDARIHSHLFELDENIHARTWLAQILENRIHEGFERKILASDQSSLTKSEQPQSSKMNYYLFEERFRGSRNAIKNQQLAFLPYFEKCSCVLDIGCGRGEFLEILRDHEIGCTGIDIDNDMVQYCRSRHLQVEQTDAISYLEKLPDNCLDGIFIDQVVEHLEPGYLVRMLALCYQKLDNGGNIVVETVNPLSLASFFNFYLDLSHYKPVHPLTLNFLLESVGFMQNEIKYYSPIPDEVKLQKIEMPEKFSDLEHKIVNNYNHNIEILNNLLWGPRDYAVIGRK